MTQGALTSATSLSDAHSTDGEDGRRRLVLFLPGHDPTDMDYHYGRFANQAERFAKLWNVSVEVSSRLDDGTEPSARWTVASHGPNWRSRTDYGILRWDDIVVELDERSDLVRLQRGMRALWEFLINGTAARYFKASPRYGFFFIFPFLIVGLFAIAGILAGWGAAVLAEWVVPDPFSILIGIAVAVGVFMGLFHQPGRRWRLHQALDDWDLAREYLRQRVPTLEARLDQFADLLVTAVHSRRHDEILLVGHSLGATLILGVLDRALAIDPRLAEGPTKLNLLTCGATIPKFALHPKGHRMREQSARVAAAPGLCWVEFQARHDAISFYKFHPVSLRRAEFDDASHGLPRLRNASIKQMLSHEKLRKLRWHAMRIHYQFLLANERPAGYDYFMFALGPLPFTDLAFLPEGPIGQFGPDGALLASQN